MNNDDEGKMINLMHAIFTRIKRAPTTRAMDAAALAILLQVMLNPLTPPEKQQSIDYYQTILSYLRAAREAASSAPGKPSVKAGRGFWADFKAGFARGRADGKAGVKADRGFWAIFKAPLGPIPPEFDIEAFEERAAFQEHETGVNQGDAEHAAKALAKRSH